MSQEEARKLLDAWEFFDKHPDFKNWEGMPRGEFYRLMQIITGTDNLLEAKAYLGKIAQGEITGDIPVALLEAEKEGRVNPQEVEKVRSINRLTRSWLARLQPKNAEDVVEKQVAAAQLQAVIEKAERETPVLEKPAEIPPPAVSESGLQIKISQSAFESFGGLAKKATEAPLDVISFFSPAQASLNPRAQAAASNSLSLSQIAQKAEKLPEADKKRILALVENLRQAEFSFVRQTQLTRRFFSVREITILTGPEFGMNQAGVIALLNPGAGTFEKGPSFFARVGGQLFGDFAERKITNEASKFVASALTKAGLKAGAKTVSKAALSTILNTGIKAAAMAGGPPGWVITALLFLKDIGKKIISKAAIWIKKNFKEIVGGIMVGAGFLLGGGVGLGIAVGGGLIALGTAGLKTLAGNIGGFFSFGITNILLPSIGKPILIALISIPAAVAIILFIINSGAYITPPPASLGGLIISPYIDVKKEPSPAGPFKNSELPVTIEYTISIRAKKGTLTNLKIKDVCEIIKRGGKPDCPPAIGQPALPLEILSGTTSSYSYKRTFPAGTTFEDALAVDTISVTADAPEQKGAIAEAVASIKIGTPPEECPTGWPVYPEGNESSLNIYQGPLVPGGTHRTIQAIDVMPLSPGHKIKATHSGTVLEVTGGLPPYGTTVKLGSTCNGVKFQSWYSHLKSVSVRAGQHVSMGAIMGTSGKSGTQNPHLHYEFKNLKMQPPYIPKAVPQGCYNYIGRPCNVRIP